MRIDNVKDLELHLMELNDSVKDLVTNGLEATEIHILLSELDKTLTRGKEAIARENCCYAEAFSNIKNVERTKKHNDEFEALFDKVSLMTPLAKIQKVFVDVDDKIKYELEFEDRIGHYSIHFNDGVRDHVVEIELFRPSRIYANSRIVKTLIESPESYIESCNENEGYIIIRNDDLDKFAIFTSDDKYTFHYLKPEGFCKDADRI